MSLRLKMLQVARLAPRLLGESTALVERFLRGQLNEDGGFKGRDGRSDLYYTVFGLEGLLALRAEFDTGRTRLFLQNYSSLAQLDFVHLCCLSRCWADVAAFSPDAQREARTAQQAVAMRLKDYRSEDGGFQAVAGAPRGSAYAAFLALGALQDGAAELPAPERLKNALLSLKTPDGAFTNDACVKVGSTNATAAALAVLCELGACEDQAAGDWLLARCLPQGGFLAVPKAPIPDLLSTATALHTLAALQRDFSPLKEPCLDFLDSLWTNEGGFHGHWSDHLLDCEYTYYGLLALGHLSLAGPG